MHRLLKKSFSSHSLMHWARQPQTPKWP